MPSECETDEQHEHYHHRDLSRLDEITLTAEFIDVTRALARWPRDRHVVAGDWLRGRYAVLRGELRARGAR